MFAREISKFKRAQSGGFAYIAVKNQTMSSITNHMITLEPGEHSVVVVIVVLHEGHVPVTGSIELHPSIIVVVGVVVTTTADMKKAWKIWRSLSELPHKISISHVFNAQYLFVAPDSRQARTLAAWGCLIRGEEAARSREVAAARRLAVVAQAVGNPAEEASHQVAEAFRVQLEPCFLQD